MIACTAGVALVLMDVVPPNGFAETVRYFWVGDITGIVALFPVLMSAPYAWQRWQQLPARERILDVGAFCARPCIRALDRLRSGASR